MGRTRAALLRAAGDCIQDVGVRRTTMVDVASRGGVAKGTLYNHFRTKDDLLAALVETAVTDAVAAGRQVAEEHGPVCALAQVAGDLSCSGPLRRAVADDPGLLAALVVPGSGRGWDMARAGVRDVLISGRPAGGRAEADLVLRWLVSHVMWPTTREQAQDGAARLVHGPGQPDRATDDTAGHDPPTSGAPVSTIKSPLPAEDRTVTGEALQAALVDLIELSLVAKQAHWNLIGRNFRSIHLALDELVDLARTFSDTVAERAIAIGVNPDGQTGALAEQSAVDPLEVGYVQVDKVIGYVVDRLHPMIQRFRGRMDATEKADPVTQDLFIAIIAELEKTHWMFQAEL